MKVKSYLRKYGVKGVLYSTVRAIAFARYDGFICMKCRHLLPRPGQAEGVTCPMCGTYYMRHGNSLLYDEDAQGRDDLPRGFDIAQYHKLVCTEM